ncbi:hypothetical protein NDU88_003942 [Pleurodeles waltl]|uniref:Uncharacterized protein n=1 Tax=Pleurodeles waltl TaxID=8319 RepID=A0AAV7TQG7_PLEWA|nr:hypothetical protein NDU88_003942 [Pleurodeles waltl]
MALKRILTRTKVFKNKKGRGERRNRHRRLPTGESIQLGLAVPRDHRGITQTCQRGAAFIQLQRGRPNGGGRALQAEDRAPAGGNAHLQAPKLNHTNGAQQVRCLRQIRIKKKKNAPLRRSATQATVQVAQSPPATPSPRRPLRCSARKKKKGNNKNKTI